MRKVFKLPVLNRSSEKAWQGFSGFVGSCRRVIHLPELSVEKWVKWERSPISLMTQTNSLSLQGQTPSRGMLLHVHVHRVVHVHKLSVVSATSICVEGVYLPEQRARSHAWRSLGAPYGPHTLPFVGTTCKDEMSSLPLGQPSMELVCLHHRHRSLARSLGSWQTDRHNTTPIGCEGNSRKCQSEEIKRVYHVIFTFNTQSYTHTKKGIF